MKQKLLRYGAIALGSAAGAASAAVDVSGVVTAVEAALAPAVAVGTSVIVVMAGIWVFSLIRRVMH